MALATSTRSFTVVAENGRQSFDGSVNFSSNVRTAAVMLSGFTFDFAVEDHHLNILEADADLLSVSGRTVNFRVSFNYADRNADDKYRGTVKVTVIADVV